jgi:MOSC domain-containing protein YiiM
MKVLSVNTARAAPMQINGREELTAIGKRPRSGPVAYLPLGLDGDEQADLSVHGGLAKAIYAYPHRHYPFWRTVRAQARVTGWEDELPPPGTMGENLTLDGLDERDLWIGDQLHLADGGVLIVSEPRFPCFKFNHAMGFNQATKLMGQNGWCGFYLAVRVAGTLQAGQSFDLIPGPREVGIRELFLSRLHRNKL